LWQKRQYRAALKDKEIAMKKNKWLTFSLVGVAVAVSGSASAIQTRYVEQSNWEMAVNTPLECQLVHPIPNYGGVYVSCQQKD
jgi:hypothetical protein